MSTEAARPAGETTSVLLELDESERTPLHWAAEQSNVRAVQILLDQGAGLHAQEMDFDGGVVRTIA